MRPATARSSIRRRTTTWSFLTCSVTTLCRRRSSHPPTVRADLLTTVMHEMGHEIGLAPDDLGDLMDAMLPPSVRRPVAANS